MNGLLDKPLASVATALATRRVDPVELLEATLERMTARQHIGAFISVDAAGARKTAEAAWARQRDDRLASLLDGVPIALKDNIVTQGIRTTCGSRLLEDWTPPYDSTVSERLRRAGAIIVGKTALDEFGMGSSGEFCALVSTENPNAPGRVPGGSSSGSAAAVASGEIFGALGSDTGGSIRLPAAFCGVWGLLPSYGRVSRHGLVAHASSLDRVGPLARSARDLAVLLEVISGPDPRDATCSTRSRERHDELSAGRPPPLAIGKPHARLLAALEPSVATAVEEVARALDRAGHKVLSIDLPSGELALDAYYVIASAEAASNLARFDGMRFGHRVEREGFSETVRASRTSGFGPEVKRRILLGSWVSSTAQFKDVYLGALRARTNTIRTYEKLFTSVDVLLGPVASTGPFLRGERLEDPLLMYGTDRWTIPSSLAGLCGITIPVRGGSVPAAALLTGPPFRETQLITLARQLEANAPETVGCEVPILD